MNITTTRLFENPVRYARQRLAFVKIHLPALRFSERKLLLLFIDLLILSSSLIFLAITSPSSFELSLFSFWSNIHWFVVLWWLWFVFGFIANIYDLSRAAHPLKSFWATSGTALITSSLYLLVPFVTPVLPERRLFLLFFPLLTVAGIGLWRIVYATIFVQSVFRQRAIVIGAGESGCALAEAVALFQDEEISSTDGLGYDLIGFIDDDPRKQNMILADIPVLGSGQDLLSLVYEKRPDEIVLAITNTQQINPDLFQKILHCRELGIPITTMASLYERMTGRVPIQFAGRNLHVVLPVEPPVSHRLYLLMQRIVDLFVALIGMIGLVVFVPIVWLANWLTGNYGPLFFYQERVGEGGKAFQVVKFRSMIMNAEKQTGAIWASENDPRITSVGCILRRTRLDEVPQFWNVLRGEMSVIGPRPERPCFVNHLAEEIPFYRVRHAVKPGITGWAQAMYRYGASTEDARIKLEYDLYYIKHQSFYLDFQIFFKTIQVVFGLKGR